jgi:hypothetical protein
MVWSDTDERFQENLEADRAYYDQHWTLRALAQQSPSTGRLGGCCRMCAGQAPWAGTPKGKPPCARSMSTGARYGRPTGNALGSLPAMERMLTQGGRVRGAPA